MTEQNNKNQPNNSGESAPDAISTLVRLALNSLSSPSFLNTLAVHPLIGNFLVAALAGGTLTSGYLLFSEGDPTQVSATGMCEQVIDSDITAQLSIIRPQITDITADSAKSNVDNSLFSCQYSIVEGSDASKIRTEDFHIVYQVVEDELADSVNERKIERTALENVCDDKDYYESELAERFDPDTQEIEEKMLVLQPDPENAFYPVFRWKCRYKIIPKNYEKPDRPTAQIPYDFVGLDLDAYCDSRFAEDSLTKARYHYYNDPNSLYCVDPNF